MNAPSSNRDAIIAGFLAKCGWADAARDKLPGDASFRRYERLTLDGRRAMLMDAPPPKEDVRPFLRVARHLTKLGFSAPHVFEADEANGLLLLEDLGDDTFTRLLAKGADERALYELAVDTLIGLHLVPIDKVLPLSTPPYDEAKLLEEARLLTDWFMPAMDIAPTPDALAAYAAAWREAFAALDRQPYTLVLRDYHVDNLMRLPARAGIAACGLLDFQDALVGPTAYDFVSLLEDARRDLAPGLAEAMTARYLAAFPQLDRDAFAAACAVLAAQRNAKIVGIFTRLSRRDGKHHYLGHVPRVWRLLQHDLTHPALAGVRAWMDRHVPADMRRAPDRP
ncbi:MAG: aminoglycoside phosphotransferase family protein [Alphaproteobacteria bacterium]